MRWLISLGSPLDQLQRQGRTPFCETNSGAPFRRFQHGSDLEVNTFAFLKVADDLKEVAPLQISKRLYVARAAEAWSRRLSLLIDWGASGSRRARRSAPIELAETRPSAGRRGDFQRSGNSKLSAG